MLTKYLKFPNKKLSAKIRIISIWISFVRQKSLLIKIKFPWILRAKKTRFFISFVLALSQLTSFQFILNHEAASPKLNLPFAEFQRILHWNVSFMIANVSMFWGPWSMVAGFEPMAIFTRAQIIFSLFSVIIIWSFGKMWLRLFEKLYLKKIWN